MDTNIFVFGASGHAKVVIDIIERQKEFSISCLVDDNPGLKGKTIYGYNVLGGKTDLLEKRYFLSLTKGIVAIGDNVARMKVATWLLEKNFRMITAIHPSAQLARGVLVGTGTVIMAGVVINSDSVIGEQAIINTGTTIDHDCVIGSGVHVAPGSTLCGAVKVGDSSFIGAGTNIIPNVLIGHSVVVGAGATVISNLPDDVTALGIPAKIIKKARE